MAGMLAPCKNKRDFFSRIQRRNLRQSNLHCKHGRRQYPNFTHPPAGNFGKYLTIPHVFFSYGHPEILASLEDCKQRQLLARAKDPNYKKHGQALTWRFKSDKKGWRILVSATLPTPQWKTNKDKGVIGIDISTDNLALVEIARPTLAHRSLKTGYDRGL